MVRHPRCCAVAPSSTLGLARAAGSWWPPCPAARAEPTIGRDANPGAALRTARGSVGRRAARGRTPRSPGPPALRLPHAAPRATRAPRRADPRAVVRRGGTVGWRRAAASPALPAAAGARRRSAGGARGAAAALPRRRLDRLGVRARGPGGGAHVIRGRRPRGRLGARAGRARRRRAGPAPGSRGGLARPLPRGARGTAYRAARDRGPQRRRARRRRAARRRAGGPARGRGGAVPRVGADRAAAGAAAPWQRRRGAVRLRRVPRPAARRTRIRTRAAAARPARAAAARRAPHRSPGAAPRVLAGARARVPRPARAGDGELADVLGTGAADLAKLLPEIGARLDLAPAPVAGDPEAELRRLFDAVIAVVRRLARRRPLLLVVDDLHWA